MEVFAKKVAKNLVTELNISSSKSVSEFKESVLGLISASESEYGFDTLFRNKLKKEKVHVPALVYYLSGALQNDASNRDEELQARFMSSALLTEIGQAMVRRNMVGMPNDLGVCLENESLSLAEALVSVGTYLEGLEPLVISTDKTSREIVNVISLEVTDTSILRNVGSLLAIAGKIEDWKLIKEAYVRYHKNSDALLSDVVEICAKTIRLCTQNKDTEAFLDYIYTLTVESIQHLTKNGLNSSCSRAIDMMVGFVEKGITARAGDIENLKAFKYDVMVEHAAIEHEISLTNDEKQAVDSKLDAMTSKLRL